MLFTQLLLEDTYTKDLLNNNKTIRRKLFQASRWKRPTLSRIVCSLNLLKLLNPCGVK